MPLRRITCVVQVSMRTSGGCPVRWRCPISVPQILAYATHLRLRPLAGGPFPEPNPFKCGLAARPIPSSLFRRGLGTCDARNTNVCGQKLKLYNPSGQLNWKFLWRVVCPDPRTAHLSRTERDTSFGRFSIPTVGSAYMRWRRPAS
jgi:hypothetical protein